MSETIVQTITETRQRLNKTRTAANAWKKLGFNAKPQEVLDEVRKEANDPAVYMVESMLYKARKLVFPELTKKIVRTSQPAVSFTIDSATLTLASQLVKQVGDINKAKSVLDMLVVR